MAGPAAVLIGMFVILPFVFAILLSFTNQRLISPNPTEFVGFANYKTIVKSSDVGFNNKVSRGISTGERLLYTSEKPAYLAKNRYSLPDS